MALLARGEVGLDAAAQEVRQAGGTALPIATDVADQEQVEPGRVTPGGTRGWRTSAPALPA